MTYIQENKEAYNAIATPFSQSRTLRFGELVILLRYVHPYDTVVDVGCGTGRLYQLLAQNQALGEGGQYIGVDQSTAQLDAAKKDFPDAIWEEGEMQTLPVEDAKADVVFCIATFHHLPDTQSRLAALKEMHRILKPGGKLIMSNWNFESDWVASKLAGPDTPGIESKWERDGDHFFVPWMNPKRDILGTRHYWAISQEEHEALQTKAGFHFQEWFYTRREEKVDNVRLGMNIVTIAIKK